MQRTEVGEEMKDHRKKISFFFFKIKFFFVCFCGTFTEFGFIKEINGESVKMHRTWICNQQITTHS